MASSLASCRVRGRPGDHHRCAVAVYLHAVLEADPRVEMVKVGQGSVRVSLAGRHCWIDVLSPSAVRAFIESFDQGLFLSLVQPAGSDGRVGDESGVSPSFSGQAAT